MVQSAIPSTRSNRTRAIIEPHSVVEAAELAVNACPAPVLDCLSLDFQVGTMPILLRRLTLIQNGYSRFEPRSLDR